MNTTEDIEIESDDESGSSEPTCSAQFDVNYYSRGEFSHKYSERWETLPELHCPHCGEKRAWHETSGGDYYVEEQYMCAACGAGWYMPGGVNPDEKKDEQGRQRFAAILQNAEVTHARNER